MGRLAEVSQGRQQEMEGLVVNVHHADASPARLWPCWEGSDGGAPEGACAQGGGQVWRWREPQRSGVVSGGDKDFCVSVADSLDEKA